MAQQLLDGAQVAAGAQQVGGEGMAQRVRRHAVGEAELVADVAHALLHDGGIERAAARAEKKAWLAGSGFSAGQVSR